MYSGAEDVARANLALRNELDALSAEVEALRRAREEKVRALQALAPRYRELQERFSARNVREVLARAVAEAEAAAAATRTAFLEPPRKDEDAVAAFVVEYSKQRALFHSRRAKLERLERVAR